MYFFFQPGLQLAFEHLMRMSNISCPHLLAGLCYRPTMQHISDGSQRKAHTQVQYLEGALDSFVLVL